MQTEVYDYMPKGLAGQLADIGDNNVDTYANENANAMPFGVFVTKGSGEGLADLPNAAADITGLVGLGVVLRSHTIPEGQGYANEHPMPVINQGHVWVPVEDAVVAESAAYVRFSAGAGGSQLGALRSDDDTGTAAALPGAKFVTDAQAGELAMLKLNLP